MSRKALGKGIGALLGDLEENGAAAASVVDVPLASLKPSPVQPRRGFPRETLEELARSVRQKGVLQPLLVERQGNDYFIVAGERRFRAAKMAGLESVPAIVKTFEPQEKLEIALIENLQREDLTPVEEAGAYRRLMEIADLRQEEVAARVGKSRSAVANSLRLLKLPEEMLAALESGKISAGHGRALLAAANPSDQRLLFERIVESGLSVRQAEVEALRLSRGRRPKTDRSRAGRKKLSPELTQIQERLIETLGTKVALRGTAQRGIIQVSYFSQDDLERLMEVLGVE